jgi:hypothetical protein
LHGLHFAAAQGLHGLQGLAAAQGLHGLQAAAAQGLHGLQAAAAQGLHGLQPAAICTEVSRVLAEAAGRATAEVARVATLRATTVFFSIIILPNKDAGQAGENPRARSPRTAPSGMPACLEQVVSFWH